MVRSARAVDEKLLSVCRRLVRWGILGRAYLGGGTGLALQINHRVSLDLAFFLFKGEVLDPERLLRGVEATFGTAAVALDFRSGDQLDLVVDGIKVSFSAYPFAPIEPLVAGDQVGLPGLLLASLPEIALMKAYAIGRRAVFRDYIDMYILLKAGHVSLHYIHEMAARKFVLQGEPIFSMRLFLQQLAYTADTGSREEKESAVSMLMATGPTPEAIENYLATVVGEFIGRLSRDMEGTSP